MPEQPRIFLFQALHDMLRCDLHIWQGLHVFRMVPDSRHSKDQALLQDVTQQDLYAKPIFSRTCMIIEALGGPASFCPCQGPWCPMTSMMARSCHPDMRHQVVQVPEVLVCRHSSHSALRCCA